CPEEDGLMLPEVPGAQATAVSSAHLLGWSRFLRPGAYKLRRSLRRLDLIKSNQLIGGREAAAAARGAQIPLIIRGGYIPSLNARQAGADKEKTADFFAEEAAGLQNASLVIITTPTLRDYLISEHRVPVEKIRIIGNYVPDYFFQASEVVLQFEPKLHVLTVGRHHWEKGYDILISALARLKEVKWRCIGGGKGLDADREQSSRLGIDAEFFERVPHEAMPQHYRWAQVFVLASRYEGHPKALLEAMACGCACVVVKAPGNLDDVVNERTALVVAPDADALYEALVRLRDDSALRQRLGAAASAYVAERYRLGRIAQMELAVYCEALEKERRPTN
ncbi:MAG: glycosyltransferase family 4 protein, partial [Planctomycetota bacterium]|nr:glycosyltransferase family 4 protein [Planctomycetota bacterium]